MLLQTLEIGVAEINKSLKVMFFVAEMNDFVNAASSGNADDCKAATMISSVASVTKGVDKAIVEEFVEAKAAMFTTGVHMLVASYCLSDLKCLSKQHLDKDWSRSTATF